MRGSRGGIDPVPREAVVGNRDRRRFGVNRSRRNALAKSVAGTIARPVGGDTRSGTRTTEPVVGVDASPRSFLTAILGPAPGGFLAESHEVARHGIRENQRDQKDVEATNRHVLIPV